MKKSNPVLYPPLVFNVFKPARITSYDVVRTFKRHLPPGFGKIGHFGTLDPFACGVLMIGIGGAARLNDFIHDCLPKTYLAVGKLGIETPTGDHESEIVQRDESPYLRQEIARLPVTFLDARIKEKFLGPYWQTPHKFSATKFMGRNLHEWAREGVVVKKEPVLRHIHDIEVVKYRFPYLVIRAQVSSGTYIRTLFTDICQDLGTIGSLIALVRERVGEVGIEKALKRAQWPLDKSIAIMDQGMRIDEVLPFSSLTLSPEQSRVFKNGGFLNCDGLSDRSNGKIINDFAWARDGSGKLLGLTEKRNQEYWPKINFSSEN